VRRRAAALRRRVSALPPAMRRPARSRRSRVVGSLIHGPELDGPRSKPPKPIKPTHLDSHRWILIRWIRSSPSALTARFCLRNPELFQNCDPVLPPLRKPLRIGPVFFSLTRELKFYFQNSPKTCFSRNLVVLAPF
jgi:hypothetical protein